MNTERYQVWAIDEVAPDFHHRAYAVGHPTTLGTAERTAERRNTSAARRHNTAIRYVVLRADEVPPRFDDESLAYIRESHA